MSWHCFAEIVDVTTQIATTIIAGFGAWVAYRTLLKTPEQKPEEASAIADVNEAFNQKRVVVFQTTNQKTILSVTRDGLECHLEDERKSKPSGLQWRLTKDQASAILVARDFRAFPGYRLNSGVFSIGQRRNWLYSKKLYPEYSLLESEIETLLRYAST